MKLYPTRKSAQEYLPYSEHFSDAILAGTDETLDFTNKASLFIILFYRFCLLFASMPFRLAYTYFRRKLKLVRIKCFSVFYYLASLYRK